ncbi:MAG: EF-hand domain-containing protein [Verrucomicrobiota bacterium]
MTTKVILSALALSASTFLLLAEDSSTRPAGGPRPPRGEEGGGPGGPGHRPPPPVIVVLDANHDGVIDAAEIANASQALLTLDKDGDGQLTREELRPPRPEGPVGDDRPTGE